MISPEEYFQKYLKDKNEKEILKQIQKIKRKINKLKRTIEEKNIVEAHSFPNIELQISYNRLYLKEGIKALESLGKIYTPSRLELKSFKFNENIKNISSLCFSIGCYFDGYNIYNIDLTSTEAKITVSHSFSPLSEDINFDSKTFYINKEKFLKKLKSFYIGEWKRYYCQPEICDGTQWDLTIKFTNEIKVLKYGGDNGFPYNFAEFKKFIKKL
ncbi:MAG: hypothetical protein ACLVH8_09755 [Fusobacterium sp.]